MPYQKTTLVCVYINMILRVIPPLLAPSYRGTSRFPSSSIVCKNLHNRKKQFKCPCTCPCCSPTQMILWLLTRVMGKTLNSRLVDEVVDLGWTCCSSVILDFDLYLLFLDLVLEGFQIYQIINP